MQLKQWDYEQLEAAAQSAELTESAIRQVVKADNELLAAMVMDILEAQCKIRQKLDMMLSLVEPEG